MIGGEVHVAQQALASGQSATLRAGGAAAPWPGASFGDVLVEQRQIWDDTGWQVISPMGYAAQGEFSQSDSFVFGMSTSTQMEAIVNGSPQMVDGPTVWTTPFSTQGFPSGKTIGRVVGVGDWRHIEASQGNIWIETDRIVTSYDVPTDATETPEDGRQLRGHRRGGDVELVDRRLRRGRARSGVRSGELPICIGRGHRADICGKQRGAAISTIHLRGVGKRGA